MKFLFASLFVVFAVAITATHAGRREEWAAYKKSQNKTDNQNKEVEALREDIFWKKDKEIKNHNRNPKRTFDRAHNRFSDMTDAERAEFHGLANPPSARLLERVPLDLEDRQTPPTSLDYRNDTCLPKSVKNQGSCGSCWAFTAITPLEFSRCKKNKTSVVLSEQQLVDCDKSNGGCNGGWYTSAWAYLRNGSARQSLYTYTGVQGTTCKFTSPMIAAKVSAMYGYFSTEVAMQNALVRYGPLAVAISVQVPFYSYKSGVYTDKSCLNMGVNHGVVVVGYGTLNGVKHWVVRNSWGASWGMGGYILMERGVNLCMIETYAAAVVAA